METCTQQRQLKQPIKTKNNYYLLELFTVLYILLPRLNSMHINFTHRIHKKTAERRKYRSAVNTKSES